MENFIIEKFVCTTEEGTVEFYVDPVDGELKIETQKEIISISNEMAKKILEKSLNRIEEWEFSKKRKQNKFKSFLFL